MQEQVINNMSDEIIITQFVQTLKNIFVNIFVFILCTFLFMNPVLLVNVLLFISIYLFIKTSISFFYEDNIPQSETEIKINFDESELLKDRIRYLKKENSILKDKLDRTERKHKKKEKLPLFHQTKKPFKINVKFPDEIKKDIDVKVEKEVEKEIEKEVEKEIEKEVEKEVEKEIEKEIEKEVEKEVEKHVIDFDKIISDVLNDMIKNSDMLKEDDFAILSNTPNNSEENSDEEN
jgi:hypothetical protein